MSAKNWHITNCALISDWGFWQNIYVVETAVWGGSSLQCFDKQSWSLYGSRIYNFYIFTTENLWLLSLGHKNDSCLQWHYILLTRQYWYTTLLHCDNIVNFILLRQIHCKYTQQTKLKMIDNKVIITFSSEWMCGVICRTVPVVVNRSVHLEVLVVQPSQLRRSQHLPTKREFIILQTE